MLHVGTLLDGSGEPARTNQRVVIERGLITEVGDADRGPFDIDAPNAVLTPGLVMTALAPEPDDALRALLEHGVTTAELISTDTARLVATRERIGVARHRGPRIVAGTLLAQADSVQEMRGSVRKAAEQSAEAVHLARGEGVAEALCAFIDEAHAQDMQAMVTVDNAAALEAVRDCSAATVIWRAAHAPHLDPEPLREAPEVIVDVNSGLPSARHWQDVAGLTGLTYETQLLQGASYAALVNRPVAAGLSRETTIRALTHGPASALGLQDALGLIAKGYRADLVLSEPDGPVQRVFIDGIEQHLGPPSLRERVASWFD